MIWISLYGYYLLRKVIIIRLLLQESISTHVRPWQIHVKVRQNQYNKVKKKKELKKNKVCTKRKYIKYFNMFNKQYHCVLNILNTQKEKWKFLSSLFCHVVGEGVIRGEVRMLVVFSNYMNLGTVISQYITATTTIKTLKTRINLLLPSRHSL